MAVKLVECPSCGSVDCDCYGKDDNGKQRYRCNNPECSRQTFVEKYTYKACDPYIRSRVFFATVNGDECRAISRILGINKDSVGNILKTVKADIWNVNYDYIERHKDIQAELVQVDEAEFDEMWNFYGDKKHQIWLWWAIDHNTGEPLAFCFGTREHKYLDELLSPFNIKIAYTDANYAYESRLTKW